MSNLVTLETPYIVLGLWIVTFGVGSLGESGPNAPMVDGTNNLNSYCLLNSIMLCKPSIFTLKNIHYFKIDSTENFYIFCIYFYY